MPARPPINNHPVVGIGNRPVAGNTVNVNRAVNVNRQNQINNRVLVNRPNGVYRPGYAHYQNNYGGWHHGYWNSWNYRPWLWGGAGLTTGLILGAASSNVDYANPYYDAPPAMAMQVFDYAQPIPVPEPDPIAEIPPDGTVDDQSVSQSPPPDDETAVAAKLMDAARDAFMKQDYDTAQQAIDKAVSLLPSDTTLHEFRALVLFARKDYREAAAVIHAVLAVGPGWDWDTLKSFYPDTAVYTSQLRALEEYCNANPMAASARFLLAYQYLTLDSRDAAVKMLKSVVQLLPTDELAAYLLKSLDQTAEPDRPVPGM